MENLFQQLGLNEPQDWMTKEDILKAKKLIQKFHMVFSKNDLDLGKTDKVKYRIKVTDPIPFKERYRRIPPSQYDAVKKHLYEMLDLGAIRREGVRTDPKKIEVVQKWERPHNINTVRKFLGFVNYYRKFIKDHSKIARPLYNLISGDNAKRRTNSVEWSHAAAEAFQTLIDRCTHAPILAYADFSLPFELHIDASGIGLGALLYQTQEGKKRVIAYASRTLSQSEARYPAHKLEFLALKWAPTDQFYEYLYGNSSAVYTDNNPLTYILTTAKLDACGQRWVSAIAPMDFTLHYKPGRTTLMLMHCLD